MRVLLAGDTHGDLPHVRYLLTTAAEQQCDRVVQVGDFGFWPHVAPFHEQVAAAAADAGLDWYWLDGNHENFDVLERSVDMTADGPQQMAERLWYLPRASTWDWDGCRFMAVGGAPSVDKAYRQEGSTWWPQELLTPEQVARAQNRGAVDVLLTHDAPEGVVPIVGPSYKGDAVSQQHREIISSIATSARPGLLVHGHYHHRYSSSLGRMRVEGLGRDGQAGLSWMVLDTADWT